MALPRLSATGRTTPWVSGTSSSARTGEAPPCKPTPGGERRPRSRSSFSFETPHYSRYAPNKVFSRQVWLILVALCLLSCNVVVSPGKQQCERASDCTVRGFEGAVCEAGVCLEDPAWRCLGDVQTTEPDPLASVQVVIRLVHATDGLPPGPGTTVDVCEVGDPECMSIDPRFPKGSAPGDDGTVTLLVPESFEGFVRVRGADIVESRVYLGRVVSKSGATEVGFSRLPGSQCRRGALRHRCRERRR